MNCSIMILCINYTLVNYITGARRRKQGARYFKPVTCNLRPVTIIFLICYIIINEKVNTRKLFQGRGSAMYLWREIHRQYHCSRSYQSGNLLSMPSSVQ